MIFIQFAQINIEDKKIFDRYFHARRYENAHLNFTNLYMWRTAYKIEWAEVEEALFIRAEWEGERLHLFPFCPLRKFDQALARLEDYVQQAGYPLLFSGLERFMVDWLEEFRPGKFLFKAHPDNFDYVYRTRDLIELKGRKYHGKKNHINAFWREYPTAVYKPLEGEVLIGQCKEMLEEWCLRRDCAGEGILAYEKTAIMEVLDHFAFLGCVGGVMQIDGRVEAFTFGEGLNEDTAVIHVEKANPDFRGIYPVVNREFCARAWENKAYINREEDMGIPGLRKAKESYQPVRMVEKFTAVIKG